MKKVNLTIDDLLKHHSKTFKEKSKSETTSYIFKQEKAKKYYEQLLKASNGKFDPKKEYDIDLNKFMEKLDVWFERYPSPPLCLSPAGLLLFLKNYKI